MTIPNDFFTVTSLGTLAGASAAVFIVTSIVGSFINATSSQNFKKIASLVLSFILAYLAASLIEDKSVTTWIVAFFNACLIYMTATGVNAIIAPKGQPESREAVATPFLKTSKAKLKNVTTTSRIRSPRLEVLTHALPDKGVEQARPAKKYEEYKTSTGIRDRFSERWW